MELKKIDNTQIYEFEVTNELTTEDVQKLSKAFQEFKDNKQKIKLLGIIDKMPFPIESSSLKEFWDMKINGINIVEKYAILTDSDLLENAIPVGNFLAPSIPVKAFDDDEREEAIAWLNKETVKEYNIEDYNSNIEIKQLNSTSYQVHINHNKINYAAMAAMYDLFKNKKDDEKLNVLMILNSFPSIDSFKTIVEGLKIDLKAIGNIKKYAIVSEVKYIETYTKIGNFLTPGLDMKYFHETEIEEARNWITE